MNEHAKLPPQPTSSMKQFEILVGEWNTVGTHPALPDAAHGHSSFEWLVEGALLLWRCDWQPGGIPSGLSVIGHDDSVGTCCMLASDEQGVFRILQMSLEGGVWKMWRDAPEFSPRMTGTLSSDGNTIPCQWEWSYDEEHGEQNLDVTYTRKP